MSLLVNQYYWPLTHISAIQNTNMSTCAHCIYLEMSVLSWLIPGLSLIHLSPSDWCAILLVLLINYIYYFIQPWPDVLIISFIIGDHDLGHLVSLQCCFASSQEHRAFHLWGWKRRFNWDISHQIRRCHILQLVPIGYHYLFATKPRSNFLQHSKRHWNLVEGLDVHRTIEPSRWCNSNCKKFSNLYYQVIVAIVYNYSRLGCQLILFYCYHSIIIILLYYTVWLIILWMPKLRH